TVLLIVGFSRSVQFTAVQSLAYADIATEDTSRATSFSAMMQQLMQSVGVGIAALIVHLSLVWRGHAAIAPDDISPAYFTLSAMAFASAFVFWLLPSEAGAELARRP